MLSSMTHRMENHGTNDHEYGQSDGKQPIKGSISQCPAIQKEPGQPSSEQREETYSNPPDCQGGS